MAPEGQKPSKWLCLTKLPREMYPQPIVHKALSWGAIRKSACILAEITIRKSQTTSYQHIPVSAKVLDGMIYCSTGSTDSKAVKSGFRYYFTARVIALLHLLFVLLKVFRVEREQKWTGRYVHSRYTLGIHEV
jgi:hypothetical protein